MDQETSKRTQEIVVRNVARFFVALVFIAGVISGMGASVLLDNNTRMGMMILFIVAVVVWGIWVFRPDGFYRGQ